MTETHDAERPAVLLLHGVPCGRCGLPAHSWHPGTGYTAHLDHRRTACPTHQHAKPRPGGPQ